MLDSSLKLLKEIEKNGFKAYIVGGFVRDYILNNKAYDVDITTNATPKDIKDIFPECFIPNEAYGSITVVFNKIRFEITTFRKELTYYNNRKPIEIEYINDLLEDLKRRDFTMNTLCIDSNGEVLDLLDGKKDILNKEIDTVGDSNLKFSEDAFRILRAIRFASSLNFKLKDNVKSAIISNKSYLNNISYNRKKEELDKIFMSSNAKYGINLILELGLEQELEIYNLKDIKLSTDLIGIWASLSVSDKYPFTNNEKDLIKNIHEVMKLNNLDNHVLYKYGLYVNAIAAVNKGIDKKLVINKYNDIPIKSMTDIQISSYDIMNILNKAPGKYISKIYRDIENKILDGVIINEKESIQKYILNTY